MSKKAIPELSADTRVLFERITNLEPNEVVSYDELSKLIGRDVRGRAVSNLYQARRKALREERIVTESVIGLGIKRMTDSQVVVGFESFMSRSRRAARREATKLTSVDYPKLSRTDQTKHNAALATLGVIQHIASTSSMNRLETKVQDSSGPLPIGKTLDVFRQ